MYLLFLPAAIGILGALALSVAPLFDFRSRPLPGSVGTCAFGMLPEPIEPEPVAMLERVAA